MRRLYVSGDRLLSLAGVRGGVVFPKIRSRNKVGRLSFKKTSALAGSLLIMSEAVF